MNPNKNIGTNVLEGMTAVLLPKKGQTAEIPCKIFEVTSGRGGINFFVSTADDPQGISVAAYRVRFDRAVTQAPTNTGDGSFSLGIKCSGEAFENNLEMETARILRRAADQVENANRSGSLLDFNGNTVGSYQFDF